MGFPLVEKLVSSFADDATRSQTIRSTILQQYLKTRSNETVFRPSNLKGDVRVGR